MFLYFRASSLLNLCIDRMYLGSGNFSRTCISNSTTTAAPPITTSTAIMLDYCAKQTAGATSFTLAMSGAICSCSSNCANCSYDLSLDAAINCVTCTNFDLLYFGVCLPTCPSGTSVVGSSLTGRECVPISTSPTGFFT